MRKRNGNGLFSLKKSYVFSDEKDGSAQVLRNLTIANGFKIMLLGCENNYVVKSGCLKIHTFLQHYFIMLEISK